MPLSEDEQRILHEIERSFYEHDPAFAREVGSKALGGNASRNVKLASIGFVVGLLVLLTSFANSLALGAAGFLLMLASAFVLATNLRRLGRSMIRGRSKDLSGALGDTSRRLRSRFNREG